MTLIEFLKLQQDRGLIPARDKSEAPEWGPRSRGAEFTRAKANPGDLDETYGFTGEEYRYGIY